VRKRSINTQSERQFRLALKYQIGERKSSSHAVMLYERASEQGHAFAQNNLGVCYQIGIGVEQNLAKAVDFYRQAIAQGHMNAQGNLDRLLMAYPQLRQDNAGVVSLPTE